MSAPRMTAKEYRDYLERKHGRKVQVDRDWSGSEKRYYHGVLHDVGRYEGETLRITPPDVERHEYTPDFVTECVARYGTNTFQLGGKLYEDGIDFPVKVYHEVKGNYRLQSQDAARLRWCFAAQANPNAVFVWAKEQSTKWVWQVEIWMDGGRRRIKERNVIGFYFKDGMEVVWLKREKSAKRNPA